MEEKSKPDSETINPQENKTEIPNATLASYVSPQVRAAGTNQPNPKRQILMRLPFVLVLLIVVGIGIALNKDYLEFIFTRPEKSTSQQTSNTTEKRDLKKIELGEKTLVIKPGESYRLADDETTIQFGGSTVPDLVFGEHYSLNDIHKINSLPINGEVSFFNKGYYFKFKKTGCNTKTVFTDVPEVHVTDCSLQTTSKQAEAPTKQLKSFSKQFNLRNGADSSLTKPDSEPLIFVSFPRASLQNYSTKQLSSRVSLATGSMTSYSTDTNWDIQIVSSYGIDTIRYTAEELWNKQAKSQIIGELNVKSEVKNYTCKVLFKGNNGEQTEQCDDLVVELQFSTDKGKQTSIKLESYSKG